jgi:hypothetical protein
MRMARPLVGVVLVILLMSLSGAAGWFAGRLGMGSIVDPASLTDLEQEFVARMKGATLVGQFTIAGRDAPATPDRYEISSVEKVGEEQWRFNARLGESGVELPIVVPMRWIADTPVIMMTDSSIPTLGTFTTRVFFYRDRYAGTWQHGEVGGHLFGRIERSAPAGGVTCRS